MDTNKNFEIIEKGEALNELSLDMILGGIAPSEAGKCDYCNSCDNSSGNNCKGAEEASVIGMN